MVPDAELLAKFEEARGIAVYEAGLALVEYYLNRVVDDLKRSPSVTAGRKIVPMVEAIIRRAKDELR